MENVHESALKASQYRVPVVLAVLDGWGIAPPSNGNAITLAKTPHMHAFHASYPATTLKASGEFVGLLPSQDGNSEAGHMNIGAGRVVPQDVTVINRSIADGTFFKNPAFEQALHHVHTHRSYLHLMGLLTDWHSAHANPDHLEALLGMTRQKGVKNVCLHLFTDGRDTPPHAARDFVAHIEKSLHPHEHIATVMGRLYLDRKKDWRRTEMAFHALTIGDKALTASSALAAVDSAYRRGETDEFIMPTVIEHEGSRCRRIQSNDAVIFFNLRSDRARQLTKPFVQRHFNSLNPGSFRRRRTLKELLFVAMTDFGPDLGTSLTAFPSRDLAGTLPMVLGGLDQYYVAETEKYAHMTYFFNGGSTGQVAGEQRILVASPDVPSYDEKPEMAAHEISYVVTDLIERNAADFIAFNFANPDMIAHTGNLGASISAIETVDQCLGAIAETVFRKKGIMFITADHGNAEGLLNQQGTGIDTEHSSNPVPFILLSENHRQVRLRDDGVLGDVAPTILEVMGKKQPVEMTGRSLIIHTL